MFKDFQLISTLVNSGDRVLDLGCGDGELLKYLKEHKKIEAQGIEKKWEHVLVSMEKGIPVFSGEIDKGLEMLEDKSFDIIILSRTIQQLENPDEIIEKMLNKAQTVVISFLNYGFWSNRFAFFFRGRKPMNDANPFFWYNSPDVCPLTINDFEIYCKKKKITILKKFFLKGDWHTTNFFFPNLFAGYAIYHLKKG